MNDQKLENLLNLALDATDAEREKSLNMNFGYDRQNRIWELIVRYHGDLSGVVSGAWNICFRKCPES